MKYKVDGWNNFCRVFELPKNFSSDYCFNGGHATNFQMVDWFNPVMGIGQPAVSKEVWKKEVGEIEFVEIDETEFKEKALPWIKEKNYIKPGREYLILCDFGMAITFKKELPNPKMEVLEYIKESPDKSPNREQRRHPNKFI